MAGVEILKGGFFVAVAVGAGFIVKSSSKFQTYSCDFMGDEVRIFPPIRLSPFNKRSAAQISSDNIHKIFNGHHWPDLSAFNYKIKSEDNEISFEIIHDSNVPDDNDFPDTILLHVPSCNDEFHASNLAEKFSELLFSWMRIKTNQYWIGRNWDIKGSVIATFPISDDGIGGRKGIFSSPTFYNPHAKILPVDEEILMDCLRCIVRNYERDILSIAQSDLDFFLASGFRDTAIIQGCSIIEIARDQCLDRHRKNRNDLKTDQRSLFKHLTVGFENCFGRNLINEQPNLSDSLKNIVALRGKRAHGQPLTIGMESLMIEEMKNFPSTINEIVCWIKNI